jgi:hypothetical protein
LGATVYVPTAVEIRYRRASESGDVRQTRATVRAMRVVSIIAVLLLIALNALEFLPAASAFQSYLSGGALALGLVVLGTILAGRRLKDDTGSAVAEAARPVPVPTHASQTDAEIVNFLTCWTQALASPVRSERSA